MEESKTDYKNFVQQIIFVAIGQWLPKLKGFLIFPFIIKILGVEKYGIWSQLLTTITLIYPLAAIGLSTSLRRFLPGKKINEAKNDFWAAIILIFSNGIFFLVVLYFFSPHLAKLFFKIPEAVSLLKLAAILVPLMAVNQIFLESFVTFGQSRKYTFLTFGKETIETGLIIYFLLNGKGLLALIIISISTIALSTILAVLIFIKQVGIAWPKFGVLKPYFQLGLPLFFSSFAYWLLYSSDRYLIGYFLDIKSVGIYSGIYNLTSIIIMIAAPVYFVLLPTISKFWEENKMEEVKKYLKYSLKYSLTLSIPAIFGMSILGKQILTIVTTNEFINWWYLIPIIGGGVIFYITLSVGEYVLILAKKTPIILKFTILTALLSIALNIIFIPIFGILAAAINSFISYFIYGFAILFFSRKYLIFDLNYLFIIKSISSSILMSLFLLIVSPKGLNDLLIFIPIAATIYGLFLIILGGLDIKEIKILLKKS